MPSVPFRSSSLPRASRLLLRLHVLRSADACPLAQALVSTTLCALSELSHESKRRAVLIATASVQPVRSITSSRVYPQHSAVPREGACYAIV